jgi:hypothetical protein
MRPTFRLMLILGLGLNFSAQAEFPLLALSQIEGIVLANHGKKFTRVYDDILLVEGDRLLTLKESQVALKSIKYGCSVLVKGNSLLTVTENIDCEALAMLKEKGNIYAALGDEPGVEADLQGNGEVKQANNPNPPNTPNPRGGWLTPTESVLIGFGTVFIGAGVAAGLAATSRVELATPDGSNP